MSSATPAYLFAQRPDWTVLFWFAIGGVFLVSWWAHARERKLPGGDNRDGGSHGAVVLFSFVSMAGAFGIPHFLPGARIPLPGPVVFYTAIALSWAGILLYLTAILTLGAFFRTRVQLLDGQKLVTRGPYRFLRHPAYTGGILIFAGISLTTGNWLSFLFGTAAICIGYARRIHVEEIALRERFGADFETQKNRTWAVIPLLW